MHKPVAKIVNACKAAVAEMCVEDVDYMHTGGGFAESLASFTWEERINIAIDDSRHTRLHNIAVEAFANALAAAYAKDCANGADLYNNVPHIR